MRYGWVYKSILIGLLLIILSFPVLPGPDPMQPARNYRAPMISEGAFDSSQWRLNLIRHTNNGRVALLNGRLVNVGGRIDGALVTAIGRQHVTLKLAGGRAIKLELPSAKLRKNGN